MMKFYSYDYLKSRLVLTDWIQLALFVGVAALVGLAIWFYYHRNRDTKYRELAIIGVICFIIIAGVRIQDAQAKQAVLTQYTGATRLMEEVAQNLGTTPDQLYLNTEAAADGGIIKQGDQYYRTIIDPSGHFLLEAMTVHEPQIELVEVTP